MYLHLVLVIILRHYCASIWHMCTRGHAITNLLHDNECTSLETVTSTVIDHYKCISWETMTSYAHESHSFFKPRVKLSYGC